MELWVLIPLAAIAVGAFEQWLKFKAKQDKLGTSTEQLGEVVNRLESELRESEETRSKLENRIQNLETIVTSQMWDVVHSGGSDDERSPLTHPERLHIPDEDQYSEESRSAELARKLRRL